MKKLIVVALVSSFLVMTLSGCGAVMAHSTGVIGQSVLPVVQNMSHKVGSAIGRKGKGWFIKSRRARHAAQAQKKESVASASK
jgi:uncharacterized protein YceK